jgi:putative DNA primase/helicase
MILNRGREPTPEEEAADRQKVKDMIADGHFNTPHDYTKDAQRIKEESITRRLSLLTITDYKSNIVLFHEYNPFFYDKNRIFWMWNKTRCVYEMVDETDLLNIIDRELKLNGLTVNTKIKAAYMEAFKQVGRTKTPEPQPENTIQIGHDVVDIKNQTITTATPQYFYCNAIPWHIGDSEDTPVMDKLLGEWGGESQKNTLYEVLAYCMHQKTPIQILIALVGTGRNGKSKYIELLTKFLGRENIATSDLNRLLKNRFEAAKTYKKLACIIGETNYDIMSETATLKQMTGDTMIGFEYKNKNPFDDYFYTKIIMASNGLPNTQDLSEGYMRRWLIINFNNVFQEGHDVLETIPVVEYNNLARKLLRVLSQLLSRGSFTGQGTVEQRKEKYLMNSNPLVYFLQEHCEQSEDGYEKAGEVYHQFVNYLKVHKKRIIKRRNFNQLMAEEGFEPEHTKKLINDEWVMSNWITGLKLKKISLISLFSPSFHISSPYIGIQYETQEKKEKSENDINNSANNSEDYNNFEQLMCILLDRVDKTGEIGELINLGFSTSFLETCKQKGDLIEVRNGYYKLNV